MPKAFKQNKQVTYKKGEIDKESERETQTSLRLSLGIVFKWWCFQGKREWIEMPLLAMLPLVYWKKDKKKKKSDYQRFGRHIIY